MSRHRILVYFLCAFLAVACTACQPKVRNPEQLIAAGQQYNAKILRDTWGVPHLFGKTDADTAYALGYAHCEDDFSTIIEALLSSRACVASVKGRDAVLIDYAAHALRIRDLVAAKYDTDLSPEARAVCEGYAAGVNHYAALHVNEIEVRGLFPVTGQDVVAGFALKAPMFFGIDRAVQELMGGTRKHEVSVKTALNAARQWLTGGLEMGSNTFAVGPSRSADGVTRLDINSHQPYEGPVAWYEAHMHSEEGWDCVGGVFPGCPVILHGHNRNLGWAHTVNNPDLTDVYVLTMNPDNPNQYLFDGKWYDLEVRHPWIWVRMWGPIQIPIRQECLWSKHHGPVVRRPHGTYAIRYGGMDDIRQLEEWYRMDKARNLDEFKDALRMHAIASFNVGYADKEGNIYYLYNMAMPIRAEGYNWQEYLPGDTSDTLWTEFLPLEKLPQVLNPPSGFFQNCNNTPYQTTLGPGNPNPADFSPTCGIQTDMTNRAYRALELLGGDESITRDEFLAYKYDVRYSQSSVARELVDAILALPPSDDPVVREAVELIGAWDFACDAENPRAAIALLVMTPIGKARMFHQEEPDLAKTLSEMAHKLKDTHGRLDVPWKEINRLRRGTVDVGLGGGPDVLHAVYGDGPGEDGCLTAMAGDCYILIAEWDKDGKVSSQSVHQYGSATSRPDSPHYADQVPLFVDCQLRPVWLDEADIRAHLEREYRPGEEALQ